MENLSFHFFHGFLGEPRDWGPVIQRLVEEGYDSFNSYDLIDIYQSQETWVGPDLSQSDFRLQQPAGGKSVVVGYSLGGRLAMSLPAEAYDLMVLVGSHPGLLQGFEQRRTQDRLWMEKAEKLSQQDWLQQWNQQEVFSQDRVRPNREMSDERWRWHVQTLQAWSLAKQKEGRRLLAENKSKIFWLYGERDAKFKALSPELIRCLGESQVIQVPEAGHGVIFDRPDWLVQFLLREVASV